MRSLFLPELLLGEGDREAVEGKNCLTCSLHVLTNIAVMQNSKPRKTVERARRLRRVMTPPEVWLWSLLRQRPEGIRFRRQHPLGPYVLDFYCPEAKLAIEIDGIAHDMGDNPARDIARDAWLTDHDLRVARLSGGGRVEECGERGRRAGGDCSGAASWVRFPLHRFAVPLPAASRQGGKAQQQNSD